MPEQVPLQVQDYGSRGLWTLFEPIHVVSYFSEPARAPLAAAGLRGYWRAYFAIRAAPLGAVPAPVVTATFYGFAPRMVERALPGIWELVSPAEALRLRESGAVTALQSLPGWPDDERALARAADLARTAAQAADLGGRALAAANAALPWPQEPTAVLWQAATILREHRGDGHTAALLAHGLSGVDSVVLRAGHDVERSVQQAARGWTDEEWEITVADLQGRGLLDGAGRATEAGRHLVRAVEDLTNRLAAGPWLALGPADTAEFADLVSPFSAAALAAVPEMTPIGRFTPDGP